MHLYSTRKIRWFLSGLSIVCIIFVQFGTALAHGVIGARFLPATLAIDDPFVADEMSLPTFSTLKAPGSGDAPATRETDYSADISKRLSPNLGIGFAGTYKVFKGDDGSKTEGLDNFDSVLQYVLFKNSDHEMISSVKLDWSMGGTGNKLVSDKFSTFTPSLLFGKGLGDLPQGLDYLRPFALTGSFGTSVPTHGMTDDGTVIPNVAHWGFTVQYSLQYLQANVKDIGLNKFFSRLIPLVELPMQTPLNGDQKGQTTGTVNPGFIWFGRYVQVGVEAQVPVNAASGVGTGVLAQLHFYLDDIAPNIFTWTPFNGVLGPTQPK